MKWTIISVQVVLFYLASKVIDDNVIGIVVFGLIMYGGYALQERIITKNLRMED